ncbi:megakaryocyte and platelet inhibitory receptor G6b [Ambystoma mexicanum]|uniref:megakaryocyte and platelet inhibitory receptor G6b n=1 Tax=Ambystoma mexicanum TaxID=8296 RepID=UPI0037E7DBA0
MEPLPLLSCVLLATAYTGSLADLDMEVLIGGTVNMTCNLSSEGLEWWWAPRYHRCVTLSSKETVIYKRMGSATENVTEHFKGRLKIGGNGLDILLENARVNDSGTFYCAARGQISPGVNLSVSNVCNTTTPAEGADKLGHSMKLSCCRNGEGTTQNRKVSWLVNWHRLNDSLINRHLRNGAIVIQGLTAEHRGLWTCLDEDGELLTEVCLEVALAGNGTHTTAQPTPRNHKRPGSKGTSKTMRDRIMWGVAGVLATLLFILLLVGVYCCLRARNQRATARGKGGVTMDVLEPEGRRSSEVGDAEDDTLLGYAPPQTEPPQHAEDGNGEVHYCLLDFHMAEERAEPPSVSENTTLYSEVSSKS